MDQHIPVYSIGTVSELTGFSPRQLRYYETMGLLLPARSSGRQRLYAPAELDRLLALKALLAQGMTLLGAKAVLEGQAEVPAQFGAEKTTVPMVDYTALLKNLPQGKTLNSLFPVNDQGTLYRLLQRIRNQDK